MTLSRPSRGARHRGYVPVIALVVSAILVPRAARGQADVVTLHSFNGNEGYWPQGVIEATDGYFYGVTTYGGAERKGTIFRTGRTGHIDEIRARGVVVPRHDGAATLTSTYLGRTTETLVTVKCPTTCEPGPDADLDGLDDAWEIAQGIGSPADPLAAGLGDDSDGDGISNAPERDLGTRAGSGPVRVYLAEGATGTFFDTRIAILNPANDATAATLRFQTDSGDSIVYDVDLPPHARRTIVVRDIPGLASATFSTVVESSLPVIVDRTMTWGGGYGSHAETAVPAPSTTWYLAEGSTSGEFALFYLLQNPNDAVATAMVRYLRPFNQPPLEKLYSLPPHSRTTIGVDGQEPELENTDVSAVITATAPIIAERAMYRSTTTQPFAAGHESAGVTAPATHWFLAEGATGPFFDLFILLANPSETAAEVRVDYLLSTGVTHSKNYVVAPNGRFTIWVDDEQIPAGSGSRPLGNVAVSSTITSTNEVPIIVERTMWWPSPELGPNYWTESHNSPGATRTGTGWALAEGEVGGDLNAETYVLVANTSAYSGEVRVTVWFEDGTSAQRVFNVLPTSRTNLPMSVVFPDTVGKRFGTIVESLGATPAQIVVERAMYTSPGGDTWAAGTNALGTQLR